MLLIVALRDLCYQQNALCYWWVQWPLNEYTGNEAATMLKPFAASLFNAPNQTQQSQLCRLLLSFFLIFSQQIEEMNFNRNLKCHNQKRRSTLNSYYNKARI